MSKGTWPLSVAVVLTTALLLRSQIVLEPELGPVRLDGLFTLDVAERAQGVRVGISSGRLLLSYETMQRVYPLLRQWLIRTLWLFLDLFFRRPRAENIVMALLLRC